MFGHPFKYKFDALGAVISHYAEKDENWDRTGKLTAVSGYKRLRVTDVKKRFYGWEETIEVSYIVSEPGMSCGCHIFLNLKQIVDALDI